MTGITENGEIKNVRVNSEGKLEVGIEGVLPVDIQGKTININQTSDKEVTLNSSIQTLSSTATTISIGKKVTMIMIANYSESSDVTMTIGSNTYQVGANLALELPMNITITDIVLIATESNTKIQLVVKGVE